MEIEFKSNTTTVNDPTHFTTELPGSYTITYNLKKNNHTFQESITKEIQPLQYATPSFSTANVIDNCYEWFNDIDNWRKEFLLPHIYISHIAESQHKKSNLEYIMIAEIPEDIECENI